MLNTRRAAAFWINCRSLITEATSLVRKCVTGRNHRTRVSSGYLTIQVSSTRRFSVVMRRPFPLEEQKLGLIQVKLLCSALTSTLRCQPGKQQCLPPPVSQGGMTRVAGCHWQSSGTSSNGSVQHQAGHTLFCRP